MKNNRLELDENLVYRDSFLRSAGYDPGIIDELDALELRKLILMLNHIEDQKAKRTAYELAKILAKMFGG